MNCDICGSGLSSVVDKRSVKSRGEIRRRRECLKCHNRYTTYEQIRVLELFVIKRDGRRQLFNREKLQHGIGRALEKRPAFDKVEEIATRVERRIRSKGKKEIASKLIGQTVLSELKRVDKVAYLRFASVYRHFENTTDFAKELQHL